MSRVKTQSGRDWGWGWLSDSEPNTSQNSRCLRASGWSHEPNSRTLSFFAPDFALTAERPWLVGERADADEFVQSGEPPRSQSISASDPQEFFSLHAEILARLGAREFEKVVPVISESIEFTKPLQILDFARVLREPSFGQFGYGFEFEGEGMCGVTPEVLFRVNDGCLETMALAGTAPVSGASLLEDPKEMFEHSLVIENLEKVLSVWGSFERGVTSERRFGSLKHLYTSLRVRLNRRPEFEELCRSLHPTAALGGWPKQAAWAWLKNQKFHLPRLRFGAPFGYVDREQMLCLVAIRGMQWQGTCAQIHTGCGVVLGSVAEREWSELLLKRQATHAQLGLS